MRSLMMAMIIGASLSVNAQIMDESAIKLNEDAPVWTYEKCVEWAKENNISYRQALLMVENSELSLEAAKAQWQPTLNFATTHGFTNSPFAEIGSKNSYNSSYGFNAGWSVYDGGSRPNTIKQRRLQKEISQADADATFISIEHSLLQIYVNLLYVRETIAINREAEKVSKAQTERARQLMELGRISKVDYSQLAAQYEQDKYNTVNAEGNYATQLQELKKLLELTYDDSLSPQDVNWSRDDVLAPLPDINYAMSMARQADYQYKSAKLSVESAKFEEEIAKASGRPTISLSAGVGTGYYAPRGDSFGGQLKQSLNENIGLTLSIPILDQKRTKVAVAQAKIAEMNARLTEESREDVIAEEIEALYVDVRSAQARFIAGEKQEESAALTDELVNEQFNLGLVNPIDLLTAHNQLTSARYELLQAKYMAMLSKKRIELYMTNRTSLD